MPETGVIYAATKLDRYVEEAFLSAQSVKRFAPNLSITLFTDRPAHPLCALGLFDRIETIAAVTGFDSAWAEGQLGRIDCLSRTPIAARFNSTPIHAFNRPTLRPCSTSWARAKSPWSKRRRM